ncbi:Gfo/Idh/MocA family oxidoreductase [Lentisphaerota bacterium ZTH]|nr:Gfo/Idh/MocA family oxidoreductase [Lentisphaerota bacterium]WET06661.1 Gfo/Idh/MocA family oxidoreductase [Lentisphaerota bacterium ZTH]
MKNTDKIKVGIVGVGALGRHHARLYNLSKNAEVVGIYDVNPETASKVAEEFGLEVYEEVKNLAENCDALSVAVPATLHSRITVPLLEMGKHVLVEKPIAATYEQGKEMVDAAAANNVVLAVGHVERFNPAMDFLEKHAADTRFIEAHRLAKYPPPRPGQHRRGTEVSVVLDLMIHDIDLVLTMVDAEVERFDAVGIPVLSSTEDIVSVRIKFENGSCANMTASRVSEDPQRRFRVFQEDTYISMDYGTHSGMVLKKNRVGLARKDISLDEKNALAAELEDFIRSVKATKANGKVEPPKVDGCDGLKALKLAEDIVREIRRYNDHYGFKFSKVGS